MRRRTEKGVKKGFSLMDWMRLGAHAKDLAGRKGAPLRAISMAEVAEHNTEFDCWTVLKGKVYNLTPYLHYHPGGVKILTQKRVAGNDCTALFDHFHKWVNGNTMLAKCEVGWLAESLETVAEEEDLEEAIDKSLAFTNDNQETTRTSTTTPGGVSETREKSREDTNDDDDAGDKKSVPPPRSSSKTTL